MRKEAQYQRIRDYVDHPGKNKMRIALEFGVSLRSVNRWIAGYKKHGKSFFIHGNATLEPDCKISEEIRKEVVELYQGEVYQGSNFAHFTEMLDQYEILSGLSAQDYIAFPDDTLSAGMAVSYFDETSFGDEAVYDDDGGAVVSEPFVAEAVPAKVVG